MDEALDSRILPKRGRTSVSQRLVLAWRFVRLNALAPFTLHRLMAGAWTPARIKGDLRAALNVSLVAFPQGMAYALIAGLPVQFGVYSSIVAAMVAPLTASSPLTVIGPTNATAVMMSSVLLSLPSGISPVAAAGLLVMMTGVFLAIGAQLKLASMLTFVSRSVMIGYVSAAALLIFMNQLHNITGTVLAGDAPTFFDVARLTIAGLDRTNWIAVAVAALTLVCVVAFKRWLPMLPSVAFALLVVSIVASLWNLPVSYLVGLPEGGIRIDPPSLNFSWFQQMAGSAFALAFLCSLESVVMAKSLASRTGTPVNANQEAFSVGVANIASSLVGGMVASGSLTRSALNASSGATSPLASILSGVFCLIIALTLGPFLGNVPVAALAMVVSTVALSLIDRRAIRVALKSTKSDAIVLLVTFCAALLLPLDSAIFIGVAASIILFLRKASTPQLVEYTFNDEGNLSELEGERKTASITIIHVEGELFFGAADLFRDEVRKICLDPLLKVIVLRMRNARHLDATSVFALEDLIKYLRSTNRHLIVSGASRDVYRVFRNSGLLDVLDKKNFFMASPRNPNLATRNALKRAQELFGGEKADVRIYVDPSKSSSSSAT